MFRPQASRLPTASRASISLSSLSGDAARQMSPRRRGRCVFAVIAKMEYSLGFLTGCARLSVVTLTRWSWLRSRTSGHTGDPENQGQRELTGFGDVQSEAPEALAGSQNSLRISRGDRQPRSAFAGRDPSPCRRPARPAPRKSERRALEFPRARGSGPATLPAGSVTRSWPVAFSKSPLPRCPSGDKTKNSDAGL